MEPITLPGNIPGLLARGAPVVLREGVWHEWGEYDAGDSAVVHRVGEESIEVAVWGERHGSALLDVLDSSLSLDLRDPAGVDRALRWLAERTGLRTGLGAPSFRLPWTKSPRAVLAFGADAVRFDPRERTYPDEPADIVVPALASIPLDHPDADLLALVAVCLHVAGRGA